MVLCIGEKITAKVTAHKIGSKKGLSKKMKAIVAATRIVKKNICLIKILTFK
jgi:hypothetical protein